MVLFVTSRCVMLGRGRAAKVGLAKESSAGLGLVLAVEVRGGKSVHGDAS